MTDDKHKPENIRDSAWMKNAPEWLGEVIAQLTENREANAAISVRLLERERSLESHDRALENRSVILLESQAALIKAVGDLKEFANSLYGPQSAFAQLNSKLDSFQEKLEAERKANSSRHEDLVLAQKETDDHLDELERSVESEFDMFRNRMREFERRLDDLKQ